MKKDDIQEEQAVAGPPQDDLVEADHAQEQVTEPDLVQERQAEAGPPQEELMEKDDAQEEQAVGGPPQDDLVKADYAQELLAEAVQEGQAQAGPPHEDLVEEDHAKADCPNEESGETGHPSEEIKIASGFQQHKKVCWYYKLTIRLLLIIDIFSIGYIS